MSECPTCGGPCERLSEEEIDELRGCARAYHSLVKGEVVAEGQIYDGGRQELAAGGILKIHPSNNDPVAWPVLVIRMKEARVIQERTGR
jgi:hypothetical protein